MSLKGDKDFSYYVDANPGDIVEYQVEYINSSDSIMNNVIVKSWLPVNG